jgi:hypothetical protein
MNYQLQTTPITIDLWEGHREIEDHIPVSLVSKCLKTHISFHVPKFSIITHTLSPDFSGRPQTILLQSVYF